MNMKCSPAQGYGRVQKRLWQSVVKNKGWFADADISEV